MNEESIILTVGSQDRTGFIVSVETVTRRGIFQFDIIGLANKTISESKQRILSAISFSLREKKHYVNKKITTLLSPADARKEGSHFDLPIAISYLISVKKLLKKAPFSPSSKEQINPASLRASRKEDVQSSFPRTVILGELTLTGSVLPVKQIPLLIRVAMERGIDHFLIPHGNLKEAGAFEGVFVWPVRHISEIIDALDEGVKPNSVLKKFAPAAKLMPGIETSPISKLSARDDSEKKLLIDSVEGNAAAKRALEIALAGRHHILFIGTPGSGKSLLAKAARELIPEMDLSSENIFQTMQRDQERGYGSGTDNAIHFREPHHTSSYSEIIGNRHLPGEVVLANGGILFLDELAEFNRRVLEGLRQPMENKYIQKNSPVGRSDNSIIPADFILIGCMNPCDCGYASSSKQKRRGCICARSQIEKYRRKMNSPLFQRFDLCIYVESEEGSIAGFIKPETCKSGRSMRESIKRVRDVQAGRENESDTSLDAESMRIFNDILARFNLSKREEASLLKVARTIADLSGSKHIHKEHVLEASSYKNHTHMR